MDKQEHLAWCKKRALEYVERGDTEGAFASMGSDLNKHPETKNHVGMKLGIGLLMSGNLVSREQMRRFIEGFN